MQWETREPGYPVPPPTPADHALLLGLLLAAYAPYVALLVALNALLGG